MKNYERYHQLMQKIADIQYAASLLSWDQETYMPSKGSDKRAQQLSTLSGISHELATASELGDVLNQLNLDSSLTEIEKRNIKNSFKDFNQSKKYTTEFVKELSRSVSEAFQAWRVAREKSDFKIFAPVLEKLVQLKIEECKFLGYTSHPYDALLDLYEPGITTKELEKLFDDVKKQLVPFIQNIAKAPQNNDAFMYQHFDREKQWDLGINLLHQMGFDFEAGRQDLSAHPFTTSFNSKDVRVTTRISEDNFHEMIWSCIHEGGHALYEQGLPFDEYGLPSAQPTSLGIHESQSRLWENCVGRGIHYWKHNFPLLQQLFPEQFSSVSISDFYKAINIVRPSLIRTSADELTYHTHIMIRYEIEKALLEGSIEVKELPAVWNKKYKDYLNVIVPDDAQGVLQDIHWSHGSFGYFPTYSLGSFYAIQFFTQAKKELPDLEKSIEEGKLTPLLNWLREKIHKHGRFYTSNELCEAVTGEKLNFSYFMNYVNDKYSNIYSLTAVGTL